MTRYYTVTQISERISETPEGFLACYNAVLARAGELLYAPTEIDNVQPIDGVIRLTRTIEDLTAPEAMASFEGKAVTINHPPDQQFVTPDNWKEFAVGVIQNVRRGLGEDADKLIADLLITDREAISAIKNKQLRGLSCSYTALTIPTSEGRGQQVDFIGNHTAILKTGRCGSECAIFDSAPDIETKNEGKKMSLKEKVSAIFNKSFDEAMKDEDKGDDEKVSDEVDLGALIQALTERLTALEEKVGVVAVSDDDMGGDDEVSDADGDVDATAVAPAATVAPAAVSVQEQLQIMASAIAKLAGVDKETDTGSYVADAETISRAEILAPGIEKSKNMQADSLKQAYQTETGKKVIDSILSASKKTFDTADKALLFVAASEMIKSERQGKVESRSMFDSAAQNKGALTAAEINAKNAAFYSNQSK